MGMCPERKAKDITRGYLLLLQQLEGRFQLLDRCIVISGLMELYALFAHLLNLFVLVGLEQLLTLGVLVRTLEGRDRADPKNK